MAFDNFEEWEELPTCPECGKKILSTENTTLIHFTNGSFPYHSKCSRKYWYPRIGGWFRSCQDL